MRNNYKNIVLYCGPLVSFHLRADTAGFAIPCCGLCVLQLARDLCRQERKNPNGGTSPRLDDKDHGRGTGAPYSPAIKKIAGGIYPDLAQGNTISEPKCTVTDPPPSLLSLPSGLFFLGKEQNNFVGFSHTQNRPPPLPRVNWDASC
ncbi:hypothetical protein mRhiFer1_009602 [Rhinolophus ferrumequinum]|uniref:Uncharacterized protein n=1 Tax=Rhinolophus ferrumequinum TaxID=59479 RepID=A0A7J7ZQL5_RHIFE|nr:hypothetical protein mRhiFer1_009602 [Rhinolophus ferrumequinum]